MNKKFPSKSQSGISYKGLVTDDKMGDKLEVANKGEDEGTR